MALRFNRRVRILPGVTLNFSKSGVSTSFGVRGLRYTVGHGKRRVTVGLPGTGLSYTSVRSARERARTSSFDDYAAPSTRWTDRDILIVVAIAVIVVAAFIWQPYATASLLGLAIVALLLYITIFVKAPAPTCPHCGHSIDRSEQSCLSCHMRIVWIRGKAYRPSRAAD